MLGLLVFLSGCTALEINRQLDDAFGSAARTRVERLGSPATDCYLVRLNFSKSYAVVLPEKILRLGEEFSKVSVPLQFSGGGTDYAVLQCSRPNGSVENYLLQILSRQRLELYRLDSDSTAPFGANVFNGEHLLVQATDGPNVRYWYVSPSSVRGPKLIARSKLGRNKNGRAKSSARSGKSSGSRKTAPQSAELPAADLPTADLPSIQQDKTVRLEVDSPPEKSAPVEVERPGPDTGAKAVEPATGGAPKPYTIVVE